MPGAGLESLSSQGEELRAWVGVVVVDLGDE